MQSFGYSQHQSYWVSDLVQVRWRRLHVYFAEMHNSVIDGLCKAGNVDEANAIMTEMEKRCKPDKITFTSVIIGHCMKGRIFEAISIFDKMVTIGCALDNITVNSLISFLLKVGMPNEALLSNWHKRT
ncbi:hypothetical protein Pint_17037 [Pistacia integerrima]|uniref:Uncharacterized protein n=1 Tax=Pistacia integerrima TaxID=434235 RepID=A0ACC0ZCU1_9ROSI|nr:hypothetical protein Pint_17037 [Pistacia integerrima]